MLVFVVVVAVSIGGCLGIVRLFGYVVSSSRSVYGFVLARCVYLFRGGLFVCCCLCLRLSALFGWIFGVWFGVGWFR